jgi:hypothetical protein
LQKIGQAYAITVSRSDGEQRPVHQLGGLHELVQGGDGVVALDLEKGVNVMITIFGNFRRKN